MLKSRGEGFGLTAERPLEPVDLGAEKGSGNAWVGVECVGIRKHTSGGGGCLGCN